MNQIQMQEEFTVKPLLSNKIVIVAITWNLYGSLPPVNSLVQLANSKYFKNQPHLIFFGTQQCERQLWMTLCCQAKQNWQAMLKQVFPRFELKVTEVMRGLHAAVLVNKKHLNELQIYRINKLKAGALGLMGNKGAISIVFVFMGELVQFINCHLAANQNQSERRNATIVKILDKIVEKEIACDVIFLGDFNYRIDMTKQQYELMIKNHSSNTQENMKYTSMLGKEQLRRQKQLKQQFLVKFQEGAINFPPTYKLGIQNDQYNNERIPGWTDRIFHRLSTTLARVNYGCQYNIMGCDHRPVIATYHKSLDGPTFQLVKESDSCQII